MKTFLLRLSPWVVAGISMSAFVATLLGNSGCGGDEGSSGSATPTGTGGQGGTGGSSSQGVGGGKPAPLPTSASCTKADVPSATVQKATLKGSLVRKYSEGWLNSPAVADINDDKKADIVIVRDGEVVVYDASGKVQWEFKTTAGRIWASPVVADFTNDPGLEIAVAGRDKVWLLDSKGKVIPGFPVSWEDEIRGIGAGDLDGDGSLDIVASTGHSGPTDVINAWRTDGSNVPGFPPNAKNMSGCDKDKNPCYLAGCYDQNLAIGDVDGDSKQDIIAPHDNAYASFHKGTGAAFDAAPGYRSGKTPGIRYLHDLAEAKQGYSEMESTSLQAHFTNTAPAIADIDGDGSYEIVMVGSVQNASQEDREKGVGLWVMKPDATRLKGWETPFHAPDFLGGLWDLGDNMVGTTNQVSIADIDSAKPGLEMVFAGFDGRIHAVSAGKQELWSYSFTTDPQVLTGGVAIADLSGDGIPEIVFSTYSTGTNKSALVILDAGGNEVQKINLPGRGSMAVPTIADVDGDKQLEIIVPLKDADESTGESVQIYTVPGSSDNCVLWSTARGSNLRNAWVVSGTKAP
jgi:hypothetical protein